MDATVANAVAPYNYDTAVDETIVAAALEDRSQRFLADCVEREGGVSTYEAPTPVDRASLIATVELSGDFPNMALLAESGFSVDIDKPDPSISRDDFATEEEYIRATAMAGARVFAPGEGELIETCMTEDDYAPIGEAVKLSRSLQEKWFEVLREIDSSDEVDSLRVGFRDCVTAGGVGPDGSSSEYAYVPEMDGQISRQPDLQQMELVAKERGQLFAKCGKELYETKERLRKAQHDEFVDEHDEDIVRLSDYLYGEGVLDGSE